MTTKNYKSVDDYTTEELAELFSKIYNAETIEEKEEKRRAKMRKAKADFCNLNANTINEVVFIG